MAARLLHVDLDAFFVEVCRQYHPELRQAGVLVVAAGGTSGASSSPHPMRRAGFGIQRRHADRGSVRLCPQATSSRAPSVHYRDRLSAVHAVLQTSLHRSDVVPRRGLSRFCRNRNGCIRFSCFPCGGAAGSGEAAHRSRRRVGSGPPEIAKLASDYAKPRGLYGGPGPVGRGISRRLALRALPGRPQTRSDGPSWGWSMFIKCRR